MSENRISGRSFTFDMDGTAIKAESFNITISDNSATAQTAGRPDGWVEGDLSATGDIELDSRYFNLIIEKARSAGSFQQIPFFDLVAFGAAGSTRLKVEAFDCKIKISDLLSADSKGGEKTKHKIEFEVTGSDFVNINGVPYAQAEI